MPTLGEFIAHARKYGFVRRRVALSTLRGREDIFYLWRDAEHFAPLPDVRESDRLQRNTVISLCRQLAVPIEDFGL